MFRLGKVGLALASLLLVLVGLSYAGAEEPANQYFERTWATTDQPVSELIVSRTWMWGPEANTGPMFESYVEAPGGEREVQYFDKSRMEITHPDRDSSTVWYVTNGLLVVELITGQMQFGDNTFEQRQPAQVNVAGDADDPNGPTYAGFGEVLDANPAPVGAVVNQRITREGDVSTDDSLDENGILIGSVDEVTNHSIAEPFWEFMNSSGVVYQNGEYVSAQLFDPPQFATGRPISQPYWADVMVGGTERLVLMQCFERRCLTYTPGNPDGFVVEAGNVGQHYYAWRYPPDNGTASPSPSPSVTATETMTETATETVTETVSPTETVTETATATETVSPTPTEPEVDPPYLYVTDVNNDRIQMLEADDGPYIGEWTGGNGMSFVIPYGIATDSDGYVYVVDRGTSEIFKFDAYGNYVTSWGAISPNDEFQAIAVGGLFDRVYVTDWESDEVQMYSKEGQFLGAFGTSGSLEGQLSFPMGLAVDDSGVLVAEFGNHRVSKFSGAGDYIGLIGELGDGEGDFMNPTGIAIDSNGDFYVGDSLNHRVQKFNSNGDFILAWGEAGTDPGEFNQATGVAVDSDGNVYVADQFNHRIQKFSSTGEYQSQWGLVETPSDDPGAFDVPIWVAVYDPVN